MHSWTDAFTAYQLLEILIPDFASGPITVSLFQFRGSKSVHATASMSNSLSISRVRLHQPNIHGRSLSQSRGCISRGAYTSSRHPCPGKHDRSCGDAYECCSRFRSHLVLRLCCRFRSQAPAACSRRASFAAGCSRSGSGNPPSAPSQAAAPAVAAEAPASSHQRPEGASPPAALLAAFREGKRAELECEAAVSGETRQWL